MTTIAELRSRIQLLLPRQSLRGRLARGAFWSFAGSVIAQGMGFVASVVAARVLGKIGFGELGMIQSTVGMFGVFAGLGLGLTATKHVAEFRVSAPDRAGRIIGMSALIALVSGGAMTILLIVLAPFLAAHTINAPHLTPELRIGCGLLLFNALTGAQTGALAGFEAFKTIAKINFIRGLLNLPLVVGGVLLFGLTGAVGGMVAAAVAGWLINHIALRRECFRARVRPRYRGLRSEIAVLWSFSVPTVLSSSMVGPVMWVARTLLVNQPGGYAEMGIFTAATKFQTVLVMMGAAVGSALLPMLASRDSTRDDYFNRSNMLMSWLLGVIPAVPLICFPELMGLIFGADYADIASYRTVVLVMAFTCIYLYKQGLARALAAKGLMWWGFTSNAVWAVMLIGCCWLLLDWGAVGFALAFLLAYALNTVVFIPLYTHRGLVPRSTIVSGEAAVIWAVIIALCAITLLQFSLTARAIALALSLVPLSLAFWRLFAGARRAGGTPIKRAETIAKVAAEPKASGTTSSAVAEPKNEGRRASEVIAKKVSPGAWFPWKPSFFIAAGLLVGLIAFEKGPSIARRLWPERFPWTEANAQYFKALDLVTRRHLTYGPGVSNFVVPGMSRTESIVRGLVRRAPRNSWPNSCLALGVTVSLQALGDKEDLRVLTRYCDSLIGKKGAFLEPVDDMSDCMIGYDFLELLERSEDERYRRAVDSLAKFLLTEHPRTESGTLPYLPARSDVMLVDGLPAMCPFLARYGARFGNAEATGLAVKQLDEFLSTAMDEESGLPFHAYNTEGRRSGIVGWTRGTGWLAIALVDTIAYLPEGSENRTRLETAFKDLLAVIEPHQQESGCWAWAIGVPFAPEDTSGSAMIGYAIERGIALGILDEGRWAEVSSKALRGIVVNTNKAGIVTHALAECRGVGFYPRQFGPAPWAQGPATALCALVLKRQQ